MNSLNRGGGATRLTLEELLGGDRDLEGDALAWSVLPGPYPIGPGTNGCQRACWWTWHFGAAAPCFPVSAGKVPLMPGWTDPERCARTAEEAIGLWRHLGVGGECGVLLGQGLVLVDLDVEDGVEDAAGHVHGGYDGVAAFHDLLAEAELDYTAAVAPALVYRTPGRAGGRHLLYRAPAGLVSKVVPRSGVEVLGTGHYALAPGSNRKGRDPSGYRLLSVPVSGPLAVGEIPERLWAVLTAGAAPGGPGGALATSCRLGDFAPGEEVPAGARHDVCYRAALAAASGGEDPVAAIRAAVARCAGGFHLSAREIERMASNAQKWAAVNGVVTAEELAAFRRWIGDKHNGPAMAGERPGR